jgi:hypothetical protein
MRRIEISSKAQFAILSYISNYRSYYRDLYTNTGIFSEKDLVQQFEKNAREREVELFALIRERLSPESVLGRSTENTLFMEWKSKIFMFPWYDE